MRIYAFRNYAGATGAPIAFSCETWNLTRTHWGILLGRFLFTGAQIEGTQQPKGASATCLQFFCLKGHFLARHEGKPTSFGHLLETYLLNNCYLFSVDLLLAATCFFHYVLINKCSNNTTPKLLEWQGFWNWGFLGETRLGLCY